MNRYMRKPYRCNVCFKSFDTFDQARLHWFSAHERDSDSALHQNASLPHFYANPEQRPAAKGGLSD